RPLVAAVVERAKDHDRHPRFHADLRTYVTTIFAIVARGLEEYGRWKAERRLVDYVDMEERVLRLLDDAEVAQRLRDQLDLVVIDEFQDTSPIQLALFRRLETLAKQSIWVGDRKQSIFAFRGADPELMERTIDHAQQAGRTISRLSVNYRSRASLVAFVSELFTPAFARHGYVTDDVRVTSHRDDEPIGALPPLGCWWLEAKTQPQEAEAIARGVVRLLAHAADTPVVPPDGRSARPARAGDIAILAATNAETRRIADALAASGVRSVVARAGLLRTPEGTTLHAALRRVVDSHDQAAAAELEALSDFDGRSPDEWLAEHVAARAEGKRRESRGFAGLVDGQRDEIVVLSPIEAVERLITVLDLTSVCRRWPRSAQGVSNLDAFAALARRYEDHCSHVREAISLPGFLQFLVSRAKAEDDAQLAVTDDAVHVCTYHRAKGLEWPIVVLAGLDTKSRAYGVTPDAATARLERGLHHRVFAASAESDQPELQPDAPLAGRWLRLWPWPYASHQDAPLSRRAADTDEARRVGESERRESLRLLYVGFTRARDHLVLTARRDPKSGAIKAGWLESIDDGRGPLLALPTAEGERQPVAVARGGWQCGARVWRLDGAAEASVLPSLATELIDFAPARASPRERPAYRIAPARAVREWPALPTAVVTRKVRIGDRVSFAVPERDLAQAGTAVHEFLAADDSTHTTERRVDLARRLLQGRAVDRIDAEELVAAADAFRAFVDREWPNAIWHREMPIAATLGSPSGHQALEGRIDLLLETTAGWVLVDHKSYPGGESTWEARALEHAPQLAAYRQALLMSGSLPVIASLVHFTIAGGVIMLGFA
ncbi:MAG: putative UvrD/REP helicase, partial [bacterium]|nr:putative UvrD/REP helicase [bacterium]